MKIIAFVLVVLCCVIPAKADSIVPETVGFTLDNTNGTVEHFNELFNFDRDSQSVVPGTAQSLSNGPLGSFTFIGSTAQFSPASGDPASHDAFSYNFFWNNASGDAVDFRLVDIFLDYPIAHWLILAPDTTGPNFAGFTLVPPPTMTAVDIFPTDYAPGYQPTPEPSSLAFMGIGIIGMAFLLRKRPWKCVLDGPGEIHQYFPKHDIAR
jgi:hypothetical protein